MLISTLSSDPFKLSMKGYVVRRSMDKIYKSNSRFNMVLEKINEIKQAFKQNRDLSQYTAFRICHTHLKFYRKDSSFTPHYFYKKKSNTTPPPNIQIYI